VEDGAGIAGRARSLARAAGVGPACGAGAWCLAFAGLMATTPRVMPGWAALAAGLLGATLAALWWRRWRLGPHRRAAVLALLGEEVARHRPALRRNLGRAVVLDDYGRVTVDRREAAVARFLGSVGFPEGLLAQAVALAAVEALLEDAAARDLRGEAGSGGPRLGLVPADPILFEEWVAAHLRRHGWEAAATRASGDQGIDVIARKGGTSVGIQCKLYRGAVGNKAVQEVIAGIGYHGLARGAVLTNATFTRSAVDLARSAGVVLMSHHDLEDPDAALLGG